MSWRSSLSCVYRWRSTFRLAACGNGSGRCDEGSALANVISRSRARTRAASSCGGASFPNSSSSRFQYVAATAACAAQPFSAGASSVRAVTIRQVRVMSGSSIRARAATSTGCQAAFHVRPTSRQVSRQSTPSVFVAGVHPLAPAWWWNASSARRSGGGVGGGHAERGATFEEFVVAAGYDEVVIVELLCGCGVYGVVAA